jgi:K+-sensing histidine kinase KdpD
VEADIDTDIDLQSQKNEIIKRYVEDEQYRADFLEKLKPQILRGLSFVHDYKQINTQIAQNINVILESRYQGADLEEKLQKATHAEVAIYWASKFLTEKLNVARLLLDPGWISRESEKGLFRFHGQVIKYLRIYKYMFEQKQLKVANIGKSYGKVYGNSDAVGVIPHTFLDNALKYSPEGERVELFVSDEAGGIEFSVSSYGPKIEEDEKKKIFQAFVRGIHAEATGEEGAGYGLYVAQMVAHALKTSISVEQDLGRRKEDTYWTTFSVLLPMAEGA